MNGKSARAYPTKAFFVNMITRDITFEDCILDMIDNSVDGASRNEGNLQIDLTACSILSKYEISIAASEDEFSIMDNCGGMTFDDATDHAFSFGRRIDQKHNAYSIGVYGIGMKRAAFKLGRKIHVRSTFDDNGTRHAFAVPIDVDRWLKDDAPPWDFEIEEAEPLHDNGVKIVVHRLTKEAQTTLDNPEFIETLRRVIARDYSLYIRRGLRISVNGRPRTASSDRAEKERRIRSDERPLRRRDRRRQIEARRSKGLGRDRCWDGGATSRKHRAGRARAIRRRKKIWMVCRMQRQNCSLR